MTIGLLGMLLAAGGEVESPPALAFRGRLEWLGAAVATVPRESAANPGNAFLALPQLRASTELRPELRFELGAPLAAVVRPRLVLQVERARVSGTWVAERSTAGAEWIEAYVTWRVDDRVSLSYGLQSFQWGPGELTSPSNRLFHANGFVRDALYVARGRHLARVNVSVGREWSVVLLAETAPNGEAPFVAEQPFEPRAQAKVEYSGGSWYLGVTAGASRQSRAWIGEYGSVTLWEGLSAYLDALHTPGRRAWYPPEAEGGAFAQRQMETRAPRSGILGGLRYAFEGGADLRCELLFDEAGWSRADLAMAARAAAADPAQLDRYLDPGFELLGRGLVYLSLTLPELGLRRRTTVQVRYLRSLTDGSGAGFATASHAVTDAVVAFASASATHGAADGAVSRLVRGSALVGATVSW